MLVKGRAAPLGLWLLLPLVLGVSVTLWSLTLQGREIFGFLILLAIVGGAVLCWRPELGIAIFLGSFFITYGEFVPTLGPLTPNNILGAFFAVLLLLKLYQEQDFWFLKDRTIQTFLFIIVFFFLSSHVAEQQVGRSPIPMFDSTEAKLDDLITRFIFLIFFVNFIRSLRGVKLVFWTLIGLVLLTAFSGLQVSMGDGGLGGYRAYGGMGIQAAGNANRLAFYCVLGIALLWYYRQVVQSRVLWLLCTAIVPVLALTTLLTASRSGFLNLVILFFLIMVEGKFSIRRQVQTALMVVLAIYLAGHFLSDEHTERLGNILPGNSSEGTGTSSRNKRIQTIYDGLAMVYQSPFTGVGIGNFPWVRLQRYGALGSPHNSYLWAMAEGGLPVLFLYLTLFGLTLKRLLQVERKTHQADLRLIARGLRTGLMTFLFFTLFAEFWLNIMLYILVGLAIVVGRLYEQEGGSPVANSSTRKRLQAVPV